LRPEMRKSTPPKPMDPETFQKLTRCIAELLLLVMEKNRKGDGGSNVVPFRKGSNHGR